uniref:Reverse transcriptase zinc-binding domain-containing protein n=1 Tax=Oryza glaberrima TaxID=4538 RepID=I1NQW5_ORYGL
MGLLKCKGWLSRLVTKEVHSGRDVSFWKDVWCDNIPLKVRFPDLFEISHDQNATVKDTVVGREWSLEFRRNLDEQRVREVRELVELIGKAQLGTENDKVAYKALSFSQKWSVLLREEERVILGGWHEAGLGKLVQLKPQHLPSSI